jgi:glycosyltransferase involved in cell wall biosynthesis
MRVSVITVCKNAVSAIEKTLDSVISQTYPDIEYIVIDGASNDGTLEILEQHQDRIAKIISEPDQGIYSAMNKGIRASSGEYLYFLNADDYLITETTISEVIDYLQRHPDCNVVYGNIQVRHSNGNVTLHQPPKPDKILDELVVGALPHQATFTHKNVFEQLGLFNESYKIAADYEWFLRLTEHQFIQINYMPITVASYNAVGLSGDLEKSQPEVYDIQNRFVTYQTKYWIDRRIKTYQRQIIDLKVRESNQLRDLLDRCADQSNGEALSLLAKELERCKQEILMMENTKFWKLRNQWISFKKMLRLS